MKIKFYIVTYNNDKVLNEWLLKSINESNFNTEDIKFYIINNYSDSLNIDEKYKHLISYTYHNTLRPDFSTGHLARSWNQAIINGFKDLNNPDCDLVITCQNDTILKKDWFNFIQNAMIKYNFCSFGKGDQFLVFKPESIKKVGLFDERFCNIGYQEGDFFLRNLLFNENCSINDFIHDRTFNIINGTPIEETQTGFQRGEKYHLESFVYHEYSELFFKEKWSCDSNHWGDSLNHKQKILNSKAPFVKMWIMYPYFEKNIDQRVYK